RATQGERKPLLDKGGLPLPILTRSLPSPKLGVVVNGRFWEQLVFPTKVLAAVPGPFEVRIEDNAPGRDSTLRPRPAGPRLAHFRHPRPAHPGVRASGLTRQSSQLAFHSPTPWNSGTPER